MDRNAIKNLKDFLLQYNKISESCFLHCVNHLSDRDLSQDECGCVDMCTRKHVNVNHKVMQVYMDVQPQLINQRIQDMNKQQKAIEEAGKEGLETSQKSAVKNVHKDKVESADNSKVLTEAKSNSDMTDSEVVARTEQ